MLKQFQELLKNPPQPSHSSSSMLPELINEKESEEVYRQFLFFAFCIFFLKIRCLSQTNVTPWVPIFPLLAQK
uniref:Uncharacterized protein n=1 Tax=Meloidogyne enterolobii TaxID=390850 RepID=A0A6V7XLX1_MELEN|nr:unnamed protein product [Meloidogyne enterolobii]